MGMKDVTHGDVLKAIEEFDDLKREAFLKKYKRGKSTGYALEYYGKHYDYKAILAAAHQHHPGLGPLVKLSGGEDAAVKYMRRLGFRIVRTEVRWTRDELILACDFARRHDWKWMPAEHPEVQELAQLLRMMPIYPVDERPEDFRTPGSIEAKLQNINTARKGYGLKKTKGSKLDKVVLQEFIDHPEEMAAAAQAIRAGLKSGSLQSSYEAMVDIDDQDDSAPEGRLLQRKHFVRERNRKLRDRKIKKHLATHGQLACETCGFDFHVSYGDHGEGYIECHHIVPLHAAGERDTNLDHLILICSNCHRMIHRRSPWLKPEELREMLKKPDGAP